MSTIARRVGIGSALLLFAGLGAATFTRAQPASGPSTNASARRAELRESLIKLRAEVDVLQADVEAARANLLKFHELVAATNLVIFDSVAGGAMQMSEKTEKEASAILDNLKANGAELLKGIDSARLSRSVAALARGDRGAAKDVLQAMKGYENPYAPLVEVARIELTRLSTELYRKKLDLSEAEKQYQNEAR